MHILHWRREAYLLNGIRLGNFKAFAEAQGIPIRPLTLIYGANSAGKSTILHSLILARHAAETGELDVSRTAIGGDAVDLGGFRRFVYCRRASNHTEWQADLEVARMPPRVRAIAEKVSTLSVWAAIGLEVDDRGHPKAGTTPQVRVYELSADGKTLVRMSRRPDGMLRADVLNHEHAVFGHLLDAVLETYTTTSAAQESEIELLRGTLADLAPTLEARIDGLFPAGIAVQGTAESTEKAAMVPVSRARRKEELEGAVRLFFPRLLGELMSQVAEAVGTELGKLRYLGPLRSYPPRHLALAQSQDPSWVAGGGNAWEVLSRDAEVRAAVNAWLSAPHRLQTRYQLLLRDFVSIDELEGPLLEGIEALDQEGLDVKADQVGEGEWDGPYPFVKDPEAEAARLKERIRSADVEKINDIILFDERSRTPVSHRDVGIGVSQILPVLVNAYSSRDKLLAIEQPEIHLHPAVQADLGDVFIESALGERRNRMLIETHSEHLLLRIMRRMRETAQGKRNGEPPVRPSDVALLFVQRESARSVVLELRLDEEGNLLDPWPGGFFEEGFRERFPSPEDHP